MPSAINTYTIIPANSITNAQLQANSVGNINLQSAAVSGLPVAQPGIAGSNLSGFPNNINLYLNGLGGWSTPGGGTGTGKSNQETITQPGHGFTPGSVVMYSGIGTAISPGWIKAKADSAYSAEALGVVQSADDTNTFTIIYNGRITNLSGLNAGSTYFLDDSVAGKLVPIPPTINGHVVKPILVGISGVGLGVGTDAVVTMGAAYIVNSGISVSSSSSSSTGNGMSETITQPGHGFAVGNVLMYSGIGTAISPGWIKAKADNAYNAEALGVVSAVTSASQFTIVYGGRISTLSGINAGSTYFLDDNNAGALTPTAPTAVGHIIKPILVGISGIGTGVGTDAFITNYIGEIIGTSTVPTIPNNFISTSMLQSASISGNVIATQSILPGHILGGLQANRNKIINGDFAIWQRLSGLSFNINNASTKKNYTADRWNLNVVNGNGIWQVFREQRLHPYNTGGGGGFDYQDCGYSVKILCSGSDTMGDARSPNTDATRLVTFQTVIENQDLMEFNTGKDNKDITASFWVYSSKTGYIDLFIRPYSTDFAVKNSNTKGAFGYCTVNTKDTWEYKQVIFDASINAFVSNLWSNPVGTGTTVIPTLSGLAIGFTLQCGNQFQNQGLSGRVGPIGDFNKTGGIQIGSSSGQSFNTAGDYLILSNIQIETTPVGGAAIGEIVSGTVATPFESIPFAQQLMKCQRYYIRYGNSTIDPFIGIGIAQTTATLRTSISTPVSMRSAPILSLIAGWGGAGAVLSTAPTQTGTLTISGPVASESDIISNQLQFIDVASSNSSFTVGGGYLVYINTAGSSFALNADF